MLECLLTCVCVCVCVHEKAECAVGGGIGGGWLWRISQGLKAGVLGEGRRACAWERGGLFTRVLEAGKGGGLILKAFTTDPALNTGSQCSPD